MDVLDVVGLGTLWGLVVFVLCVDLQTGKVPTERFESFFQGNLLEEMATERARWWLNGSSMIISQ